MCTDQWLHDETNTRKLCDALTVLPRPIEKNVKVSLEQKKKQRILKDVQTEVPHRYYCFSAARCYLEKYFTRLTLVIDPSILKFSKYETDKHFLRVFICGQNFSMLS